MVDNLKRMFGSRRGDRLVNENENVWPGGEETESIMCVSRLSVKA